MKKDELLSMGLTDEQADKILALNGQAIEREKAKTNEAKAALKDAQDKLTENAKTLETLQAAAGDSEAVKKQLADAKAKTEELTAALAARDYADVMARAVADKGVKFSSKSAERAFMASLKEKALTVKDGALDGFDKFLEEQKTADPEAFAAEKATETAPATNVPRFVTPTGAGAGLAGKPEMTEAGRLATSIGKSASETAKSSNDIIAHYVKGE